MVDSCASTRALATSISASWAAARASADFRAASRSRASSRTTTDDSGGSTRFSGSTPAARGSNAVTVSPSLCGSSRICAGTRAPTCCRFSGWISPGTLTTSISAPRAAGSTRTETGSASLSNTPP